MDILLGANASNQQLHLRLDVANRCGLIAGATGTGKTVRLQIDVQEGILYILFTVMREKKLPLLKLEDLRTALV